MYYLSKLILPFKMSSRWLQCVRQEDNAVCNAAKAESKRQAECRSLFEGQVRKLRERLSRMAASRKAWSKGGVGLALELQEGLDFIQPRRSSDSVLTTRLRSRTHALHAQARSRFLSAWSPASPLDLQPSRAGALSEVTWC